MLKTGQGVAASSTTAVLSITRSSADLSKCAVATALPNTSFVQVTAAAGVMSMLLDSRRTSRLSRGRRMRRCGPSRTGAR
jgi:hypothetical protein